MDDPRPYVYKYWEQLMDYLEHDASVFFSKDVLYPRQFEIHLPSNHKVACNLNCGHCAGKYFIKDLGNWELTLLELLNNIKGKIPFHIYGGAYTEPLLNPYYMTFLATTKKYGNHFGIHTNGAVLYDLEEGLGWLTELNRISTDEIDYLSVAIDGGFSWSWGKVKGMKNIQVFNKILLALKQAVDIRDKNNGKGHAIRLCYLITPDNESEENIASIVAFAKSVGLDSLRFSIPFYNYNKTFYEVREYKRVIEQPKDEIYRKMLQPYLSKSKDEKPYIFYTGPEFTDIDKFDFDKCVYYAYQITCGADGYFYKCSTVATPTAKHCRLGSCTSDVNEFEQILLKNADPNWDCQRMCFNKNLRCNRMGLEINRSYKELIQGG